MRILIILTLAILTRPAFAAEQLILQCLADSKTRSALPFEVWKYDKTDEKWGKYPPLNDFFVKIIGGGDENDPESFDGMEIWKENNQKFKNNAKKFLLQAKKGGRHNPLTLFTETLQKIEVDKKTLVGTFNFYRKFIPSEPEWPKQYETQRWDLGLRDCEVYSGK